MNSWLYVAVACAVLYAAVLIAFAVAGRRSKISHLTRFVPDCALLIARLSRDPATPRRAKVVLVLAAGYLAFPIDLIPDFIPVAGQLDDVLLLGLALRYVVRSVGAEAIKRHWTGTAAGLRAVLRSAGIRSGS